MRFYFRFKSYRPLVTPAITRIDPGKNQFVNFSLKKGVIPDSEYLLKASFEGVTQSAGQGMRMPIRQDIGFMVQPKSIPVSATPWKNLIVQIDDKQITLTNPSKHVIRLGPAITLQPSGKTLPLPNAYIMPGKNVIVAYDNASSIKEISITPLSRYGLVQAAALLAVTH